MTVLLFIITTTTLLVSFFSFYVLEKDISNNSSKLGADVIIIASNGEYEDEEFINYSKHTTRYLSEDDIDSVMKYEEVENYSCQCYLTDVGDISVVGVDYASDFTIKPWLDKNVEELSGSNFISGYSLDFDKIDIYNKTFNKFSSLGYVGAGIDNVVFIDIDEARNLAKKNLKKSAIKNIDSDKLVTAALVNLKEDASITNFVDKVNANFKSVKAISKAGSIQKVESSIYATKILVFFLFLFLFINSVLALFGRYKSIFTHRKKEIGYLKSIGISNGRIFMSMIYEILLVGLFSGIISAVLSSFILPYSVSSLGKYFVSFDIVISSKVYFSMFLLSPMFTVVLGFISGFYPIMKFSRMQPISAISRGEL